MHIWSIAKVSGAKSQEIQTDINPEEERSNLPTALPREFVTHALPLYQKMDEGTSNPNLSTYKNTQMLDFDSEEVSCIQKPVSELHVHTKAQAKRLVQLNLRKLKKVIEPMGLRNQTAADEQGAQTIRPARPTQRVQKQFGTLQADTFRSEESTPNEILIINKVTHNAALKS